MRDELNEGQQYEYTLECIQHYINSMLADDNYNPPVSIHKNVMNIKELCDDVLKKNDTVTTTNQVIISCDASIINNPGGPASCGIVARWPGAQPYETAKMLPKTTTNNQAEYDAIYEAFALLNSNLVSLAPNPYVELRTDSLLVVKQLTGLQQCHDLQLQRRRDIILELWDQFVAITGAKIKVIWYARNSTKDLKTANNLAQDMLGVKNH